MHPPATTLGSIEIEVFRHLFTALAEEMGATLRRAGSSPNIKERRDYSCALFSPGGTLVAQGDHMPVHLGALPMSVAATLRALGPLAPGDVAILNDPYEGGTHLPDITMVAPAIHPASGTRLGYVAARAHHADVGGMTPGSMPIAREIFQEGLRIPPVHLIREGRRVPETWRLLLANVRTPAEREGDLDAQLGALEVGIRRLGEMADRRGAESILSAQSELVAYGDRLVHEGIRRIPAGRWTADDQLDSDGMGTESIPIRVELSTDGERIRLDFTGSGEQAAGGVNAVAAVTSSAARYVLRCVVEDLLGTDLPAGGGSMSAMELVLPEGSIVNASPPAAVAAGNVETSQRITDVLFQAFALALPDRIPALSQGTMNNMTIGGLDPRTGRHFAYYETVGGGMGAGPRASGLSGVHTHMSNTMNTPIEALEHTYPVRVLRYAIRRGSGGKGLHRGGDGLRRDVQLLAPAEVTLLSERRRQGPRGARGGEDGAVGENVLIRGTRATALADKVTFRCEAGDVVSIRSPGGGGWGVGR
ncbi:MAG: hydantoinase B/oxoprolinase family protein [Gemmatimonadota bacterium]